MCQINQNKRIHKECKIKVILNINGIRDGGIHGPWGAIPPPPPKKKFQPTTKLNPTITKIYISSPFLALQKQEKKITWTDPISILFFFFF